MDRCIDAWQLYMLESGFYTTQSMLVSSNGKYFFFVFRDDEARYESV